jgi:TRAP-type mannitol/chloroaromatic compound transport system permease small subunit
MFKKYQSKDLSDEDIVSILILGFDLLSLQSISENAKSLGKTTKGIRDFSKNKVEINQFTFVKNNE